MADNLTVGARATDATAPSADTPVDKPVDKTKEEVDKLRDLAKNRFGKHLTEDTARALVTRRAALRAHESKIRESKESFETEGRKTVLGPDKTQDVQTRALKAAGAKDVKGADGLTEDVRGQIRSDPKAGPTLPPTDAKPTTPESAAALLSLMTSCLTQNGEPLDLAAYAKTLKQLPATQPKEQPVADLRLGQTKPLAQPEKAQTPSRPQATKTANDPAATRAGQPAVLKAEPSGSALRGQGVAGQPAKLGKEPTAPGQTPTRMAKEPTGPAGRAAQAGLGAPSAASRLTFKTGGEATRTAGNPASSGTNTGGGLTNSKPFDGMRFNWEAFFTRFIIKSQKDLQTWRTALKELRRQEGEMGLVGHGLQIALANMRLFFSRAETLRGMMDAIDAMPFVFQRMRANALSGLDATRASQSRAKLSQLLAMLDPKRSLGGRWCLTPEDMKNLEALVKNLPPEERAKLAADLKAFFKDKTRGFGEELTGDDNAVIAAALQRCPELGKDYRAAAGSLGVLEMLMEARGQVQDPKSPVAAQLDKELAAANNAFLAELTDLMSNDTTAGFVNEARSSRKASMKSLDEREAKLKQELADPSTPADKKLQCQLELAALPEQRTATLRQLAVLDRGLAQAESVFPERAAAYGADLAKMNAAVDKQVAPIDAELQKTEAAISQETDPAKKADLEKRKAELEAARAAAAAPGGDLGKDPSVLKDVIDAGDAMYEKRKKFVQDPMMMRKLEIAEGGLRKFEQELSNSYFVAAVDNAVRGATQAAKEVRHQVDGNLSQAVSKAQGMINQLVQLLGMSRAR